MTKITKRNISNPFNKNIYPNVHEGYNYAIQVVSGKIVACQYVIGACMRTINDVESSNLRWKFDADRAERYLRIAQQFKHVKGKWSSPHIKFEPWQKWVWLNIEGFVIRDTGFRRFRFAHIDIARGNTKPLALDTIVPTPKGLRVWRDIEIGDELYDRNGNVCRVVNKNKTFLNKKSQKIKFSDGTEIVTGLDHEWFTSDKAERRRDSYYRGSRKTFYNTPITESIRTTGEIKDSLKYKGETNHCVYTTKPIRGRTSDLDIDPYVFGYWLGNGSSTGNVLTVCREDIKAVLSYVREAGLECYSKDYSERGAEYIRVLGIVTPLKNLGVWGNKHIPTKYLTAPVGQRRELLRGLLDADGTINKINNRVTITSGKKELWQGIEYLISSLGYKVSTKEYKVPETNNIKSNTLFKDFSFTPRGEERVFKLKRKYSNQVATQGKHKISDKRYIVDVIDWEPTEMFCVEVDSPDHSFLVTERCIATHNSTMASIAVLFNLCMDNPVGNRVSTVATTKDQAKLVFDDACAMAEANKAFLRKTGVEVQKQKILHPESNSEVRPLSSEASGLDGLNDILAVCDELHSMKRSTFEVITSGMSKRFDSLTLAITTAGDDETSVGYSEHKYAKSICLGHIKDDSRFAVVYTLDEGDDVYDPSVWIKSNPNWGVSVDPDTFKSKVFKCLEQPRDLQNVKVKHLNVWANEESAYFDTKEWDACADPDLKLEDLKKLRCMGAVDLSHYKDLSARVYVFHDPDLDKYYVWDKVFVPKDNLDDSKLAPDFFKKWAEEGWLETIDGKLIDYPTFGKDLIEECEDLNIGAVAYDPWSATEMAQRASEYVDMVSFTQNKQNFSEPTKKFDAMMKSRQLVHRGSPLMRWCLSNVVVDTDSNDNVKPRKPNGDEKLKVDPIIAAIMGIALWVQEEHSESVYEERGLLIV